MRCTSVENLKVGDVLGRAIYDNASRILLAQNTVMTDDLIKRLSKHRVYSVYIDDPNCSLGGEDVISTHTRQKAINTLREITNSALGTTVSKHKDYGVIISSITANIIDELIQQKGSLVNMIDLKDYDNYTYSHSVNVAILSIVTGISLGYEYARLLSLGTGAFLHDLGKIFVPLEILNKPDKLTSDEFNIIKSHPEKGFLKSRADDILDAPGRAVILQHHEKVDGSGYPHGKKANEIHEFAKIVAVSDVYDAVTSDRPYRKRWSPSHGLEYLYSITGSHLDYRIVTSFSKNIAPFPLGSLVQLSNGETGYVIDNSSNAHRPILQVGERCVDLQKELTLMIDKIL